eukprot:TRINITY_DN1941_c0_g1_i1.p1 TRINITY_DN1941_c0_g1~~TRINITY_DN1941_c0_g1_i1.p1  ORF type:complete len:1425 (-),score=95.15 TRINITY_DN1941_c0_g1_i1:4119-8393(-)
MEVHMVLTLLLLPSLFVLKRVYVHQNEKLEYNLAKECLTDNCVVTDTSIDPPLGGVTIVNKTVDYPRNIPAEYQAFDLHSTSVLYNSRTGMSYLILLFGNDSYALAGLSGFETVSRLHFKLRPLGGVPFNYNCTKFQNVPAKNVYESFCLVKSKNVTNFFYIRCSFGRFPNSTSPDCDWLYNTEVPCCLAADYRYHLRINLQSPYDVHVVFNKSDTFRPGTLWVVSGYSKIKQIVTPNFSTINDLIFTSRDTGKGVVVSTNEGIFYGSIMSETAKFTEPLRDNKKVTSFCAKEGYENPKGHVYAFAPEGCILRKLGNSQDWKQMRQKQTYGSSKGAYFLKPHTKGETAVKLKNYVVEIARNASTNKNVAVVFFIKDKVHKYVYDTVELAQDLQVSSLLLLNPFMDVAVIIGRKKVILLAIEETRIVFDVQKDQRLEDHYMQVKMKEKYGLYEVELKFTISILNEYDHSIKPWNTNKNVSFSGWNQEDNLHPIFQEFSGDNVSIACESFNPMYTCDITSKVEFLRSSNTNWNLTPTNSVYLLLYNSHSPIMTLWQFGKTPKTFSMPHLESLPGKPMPLWKVEPDITQSAYFGNELFTASPNLEQIYTYFTNGFGSTVSVYEMTARSLDARRFLYTTREFKITGIHYHRFNKNLYLVLRLEPQMVSYVATLDVPPYKFPYLIDYLFFDSQCTAIFHSRNVVNIFFGWDIWAANPYKSSTLPQYTKVVGYDGSYFLFIDMHIDKEVSSIEHWKPVNSCETLARVKSFNMLDGEIFNFAGTIISTIYLHYLLFVSYHPSKGYLLNVLDYGTSQRSFLYTSTPISGFDYTSAQSTTIHCLRIKGRSWVLLIGKNFYQYYILECNPYMLIRSPNVRLKEFNVTAFSDYLPKSVSIPIHYQSTRCIKDPHGWRESIYMNSTTESICLPLNHYINGFNLQYTVSVNSMYNSSLMKYSLWQNRLKEYSENPDDRIVTIYRCGENMICAYRNAIQNSVPIDKYMFSEGEIWVEPISKISAFADIANVTDIVPSQFKDISAFILVGKTRDEMLYEYLITLTANKMYELAVITADTKADYLAIDSRFNQLILHSKDNNEILSISITDKPHTRSQLILSPQNCSFSVFPTAMLFCQSMSQLITASPQCGLQIFNTGVYPYSFSQSISFYDLLNLSPKDHSLKVKGIYGCDKQLYVVFQKHGILKFFYNIDHWEYEDTIPNYNNARLSSHAAYDSSVMAIYGTMAEQAFIRIFDLSRPSHAMPVFEISVNATGKCKKLIIHSTGRAGVYHLFYLCGEKLHISSFTLTPSVKLTDIPENTFNITIAASNSNGKQASSTLILKTSSIVVLNLWYPLGVCVVFAGVVALLLYCWVKEVRDRTQYTRLIKELKEYEKTKSSLSKDSKSSSEKDELLIQQLLITKVKQVYTRLNIIIQQVIAK